MAITHWEKNMWAINWGNWAEIFYDFFDIKHLNDFKLQLVQLSFAEIRNFQIFNAFSSLRVMRENLKSKEFSFETNFCHRKLKSSWNVVESEWNEIHETKYSTFENSLETEAKYARILLNRGIFERFSISRRLWIVDCFRHFSGFSDNFFVVVLKFASENKQSKTHKGELWIWVNSKLKFSPHKCKWTWEKNENPYFSHLHDNDFVFSQFSFLFSSYLWSRKRRHKRFKIHVVRLTHIFLQQVQNVADFARFCLISIQLLTRPWQSDELGQETERKPHQRLELRKKRTFH